MATQKRKRYSKKKKGMTTGKLVLYAAGLGAVAGTGYFGYNYIRNRSIINHASDNATTTQGNTPGASTPGQSPSSQTSTNAGLPEPPLTIAFPLNPGDKNLWVQKMQQALMKLGGKVSDLIKTSGGADGVFGNGTRQALYEAGFENQYLDYFTGTSVSWEEYNKIINKAGALGSLDPKQLAKVAVSIKDTFLVDPDLLNNKQEPRVYPVKANVHLGYLINETAGLSQILHEDGKLFYTASSGIKAI